MVVEIYSCLAFASRRLVFAPETTQAVNIVSTTTIAASIHDRISDLLLPSSHNPAPLDDFSRFGRHWLMNFSRSSISSSAAECGRFLVMSVFPLLPGADTHL